MTPWYKSDFRMSFLYRGLILFCVFLAIFAANNYKYPFMNEQYKRLLQENLIKEISDEDRKKAEYLLQAIAIYSQAKCNLTYVVDYFNRSIAFISDRLRLLCDLRIQGCPQMYELFHKIFPPEDISLVEELKENAYVAFKDKRAGEKTVYSFHCDINLIVRGEKKLYNMCAIPFVRTSDGKLLMISCTFSPASRKDTGNAVIHKLDSGQLYIYNFAEHRWLERHIEPLTERERIILENSAQGLTEREISKKILRTNHSVKASKRQLFKKLEVKSTAEALEFCINHGLL